MVEKNKVGMKALQQPAWNDFHYMDGKTIKWHIVVRKIGYLSKYYNKSTKNKSHVCFQLILSSNDHHNSNFSLNLVVKSHGYKGCSEKALRREKERVL